eukprot:7375057-Pyramimonas_sp.AAC.1
MFDVYSLPTDCHWLADSRLRGLHYGPQAPAAQAGVNMLDTLPPIRAGLTSSTPPVEHRISPYSGPDPPVQRTVGGAGAGEHATGDAGVWVRVPLAPSLLNRLHCCLPALVTYKQTQRFEHSTFLPRKLGVIEDELQIPPICSGRLMSSGRCMCAAMCLAKCTPRCFLQFAKIVGNDDYSRKLRVGKTEANMSG